jgi:hypothetical protein
MVSQTARALICSVIFCSFALPATITEAIMSLAANIGPASIHNNSTSDPLRVHDEFSAHLESPPLSGEDYFLGGAIDVDVTTGGMRGRSNVFAAGGNANVRFDGIMQVRQGMGGTPGVYIIPIDMTVRFSFVPDVGAVGSFVGAEFHAGLHTRQDGGDTQNSSYRYFYTETVGAIGSVPQVTTDFTGNVLINSIFDVVLRTNLQYVCCTTDSIFIVATMTGGLSARQGGGSLNAYDSAFLTVTLPPGLAFEPGSAFLSEPFEQPAPIPEPWMTPLLGLVMIPLVAAKQWRRSV